MKKRFVIVGLLILVLCLAIGGGATAAVLAQRDVAGSVTILAPVPDIEVYSDPEGTTIVTALSFGDLYPGEASAQTVYVKNIGMVDLPNVTLSDNVVLTAGAVTYSANNFPLALEASTAVTITFTAGSSAGAGIVPFNINIAGQT